MPVFHYRCDACQKPRVRLLPASRVNDPGPCPSCGGGLIREASGPSQQVLEKIDNGLMPRAVEQLSEAHRLVNNRNSGRK